MKYLLLSAIGFALLVLGVHRFKEEKTTPVPSPRKVQTYDPIKVAIPKERTSEFTRLASKPVAPTEKVLKGLPKPCQPFVRKVLSFDAYNASKLTRNSLNPKNPDQLDKVRDDFTELVSNNKCSLDSDHPLHHSHQKMIKECSTLPKGLPHGNLKRIASVFGCLSAVRNFRMQSVLLSYGDTPLKEIESLAALTLLFEASVEIQGRSGAPDRFARSREVAEEISERLPQSSEAATLLMQTSYIDLLTQGESPERLSKLEEAKKQLEAIDSSNAKLAELRLNQLLQQGQEGEAQLLAEELSLSLPDSDVGEYYKARFEYEKGNTEQSIALLEELSRKNPKNIRAPLTLSVIQNAEELLPVEEVFIDENRTVAPREELEEAPKQSESTSA